MHQNNTSVKLAKATLWLFLAGVAVRGAEGLDGNWPRWRGPQDQGRGAPNATLPTQLSGPQNLLWKAALPGKGCSTPIVWERRIYLTAPVEGQDAVLAFDWEGRLLWQTILGPERKGKHRNGSGSNPSLAADGQGLYAYFKSGLLARLDLAGGVTWKTGLQERYGQDSLFWDIGSSPVLTKQDVVVAVMHHGNSFLAAFDKANGAVHWKVARNYETPLEGDHSYATPIVLQKGGQETVLVWGALHLTAHRAEDGQILWSCGDFNPEATTYWPAVSSAVVAGDMVVVPYGRGARLHGIRLGGTGDVTATHRAWLRKDTGSFVPTPSVSQGRVYLLRDRGEMECIDAGTGKTVGSGALPKDSSNYYASPLVAGGHVYAAREDGVVFVARVEGKFEVVSENDMGERIIASPVAVANRLLLRGEKNLFCLGTK